MADIKAVNIGSEGITVNFKVSANEYSLIKLSDKNLIILPIEPHIMDEILTTGKLGNGNRIMLPNKILKKHSVDQLHKRVPARVFEVDGSTFLLIKLEDHKPGVPIFEEKQDG